MAEEVVIGGYKRLNLLQRGQNSQVWEVLEISTNRRYAMKMLLDERSSDAEQRRALKYEAGIGKKLQHPRIIRTYAYAKANGTPYILMEHFPSQNLKLRLLGGQYLEFVRPRLRNLVEQVCQALSYMHSRKLVHRDVKPDNMLVNGSGELKLIDFALAVPVATGFSRMFTRRSKITAGTRSYMSPEQILGKPVDGRADIYSFGIMLYEMVSGRLPFVGRSGQELLRKHLATPPPPLEPSLKLTPEFEQLLGWTLEKNADKRPPSMDEFLAKFRSTKITEDETLQPEMQ